MQQASTAVLFSITKTFTVTIQRALGRIRFSTLVLLKSIGVIATSLIIKPYIKVYASGRAIYIAVAGATPKIKIGVKVK